MEDHIGMCSIPVVDMKMFIRADCAVDQQDNQHMIIRIALNSFYSRGDERRLLEGFEEISAIRGVKGVARELLLDIEIAKLSKDAMRELLALLWRYEIPLAPLQIFAKTKKFIWLNDDQGYWYDNMFKDI